MAIKLAIIEQFITLSSTSTVRRYGIGENRRFEMKMSATFLFVALALCVATSNAGDFEGLFGGGCLKPVIKNSVITPELEWYQPKYEVNDKISISCKKGYYLFDITEDLYVDGNRVYRICTITGNYNLPTHFKCTRTPPVTCDRLDVPGLIWDPDQDEYLSGDEVMFSCDEAYILYGNDISYCESNGKFSPPVPTCKPKCPKPDQNKIIVSPDQAYYRPGQRITISCEPGCELTGPKKRRCESSGKIFPEIPDDICRRLGCDAPPKISNGRYDPTLPYGELYDQGDIITYMCDINYRLVGKPQRICDATGVFIYGEPECVEIKCDRPMDIENGDFMPDDKDKYSIGEFVVYKCDVNYKLNTDSGKRTCRLNKDRITAEFEKKPKCIPVTCDDPMDLQFGSFSPIQDVYYIGAIVDYTCLPGFELQGPENAECLLNKRGLTGSFTKAPICLPLCTTPMDLANGFFEIVKDEYSIGEVVQYTCNKNYYLVGPETAECVQENAALAEFTEAPVCEPVLCLTPDSISNGEFVEVKDTYRIGETVTYSCFDTYYLVGPVVATCIEFTATSGIFTEAPTCKQILCNKPMDIDNGGFEPDDMIFYEIGDQVDYFCDKGFKFGSDIEVAICSQTGPMSAEFTPPAVCVPIMCDQPEDIDNGFFGPVEDEYPIGADVLYECDYGYKLSREPGISTCQLDANYLTASFEDPPSCIRIICKNPGAPKNGDISDKKPKFVVDESVTWSCDPCYKLVGDDSAVCLPTGVFSKPVPKCVLKTCDWYPDVPEDGYIKPLKKVYDCGEKVSYYCAEGFILIGAEYTVCQDDGTFSAKTPYCKPISCDAPKLNPYVYVRPRARSYPYLKKITFHCRGNYKLVGASSATCQLNGEFDEESPVCKPVSCGKPPVPKYGYVEDEKDEYKVDETAYYVCDYYYTMEGKDFNKCGEDGEWLYKAPVCLGPSCKGNCYLPYTDDRPCQCDSACCQRGDCCDDYKRFCGHLSCCDRCGENKLRHCRCDPECSSDNYLHKFRCCSDYLDACPGQWYLD